MPPRHISKMANGPENYTTDKNHKFIFYGCVDFKREGIPSYEIGL